jgi:Protein of unknown function (DUF4058)
MPQVAPKYIVLLDGHLYVHDLPPEPRRLVGRGDVAVAQPPGAPLGGSVLGLIEAPTRVELLAEDVERAPYLEIRDRLSRELVTVVELLSPSNKRPRARTGTSTSPGDASSWRAPPIWSRLTCFEAASPCLSSTGRPAIIRCS